MQTIIVVAFVLGLIGAGAWFAPKGWRTVVVNVLSLAFAALGPLLEFAVGFDWSRLFSPGTASLVLVAVNVANITLRSVSNTAIGKRE